MSINLKEALTGWVTRLRFITRFSNCPRIHDESVAEHSYYTAFFALLILHQLEARGMRVDRGSTLAKALMHDVDECFSGDFIRMFKHSNPELKKEIDLACERFARVLVESLSYEEGVRADLFRFWSESKQEIEGKVVSFADFLSVVSYIAQEIESGNARMKEQVPELRKFFQAFLSLEYNFLGDLISQADMMIQKMEEM